MKFFFAGHTTFGNRGCEALIRSTVGLIRQRQPQARFVVPSSAIELDRRQWPQAADNGVEFVQAPPFPASIKWWNRAVRLLPPVERSVVPRHSLPPALLDVLSGCDGMIMSGGDVISLDYGLASLYDWTGYVDNARRLGKPALLWAASVGPFKKKPHVEQHMVGHLRSYASLSVRESATHAYLAGLGIDARLVADPAFTMQPEVFDHEPLMPAGAGGVLGFNVSPLIRGYRDTEASRQALDAEIVAFIGEVLKRTDLGVLLVPHVGPLDGGSFNSDHLYMQGLLASSGLDPARVKLGPPTLNAAQLKHLISQCRFFIGARTHATVAGFSTSVPTASIAYSVKAKGINRDLFGHLDHVLETPSVTRDTLTQHLKLLQDRESDLRRFLTERIPQVRELSGAAADHALAQVAAAHA